MGIVDFSFQLKKNQPSRQSAANPMVQTNCAFDEIMGPRLLASGQANQTLWGRHHRGFRCLALLLSTAAFLTVFSVWQARPVFAAFPIPNVGGIVVTAPEIDATPASGGHSFQFAPSSTQTESQMTWPTAKLTGNDVSFPDGLTIIKTLDFTSTPLAQYGIDKVILQFHISSSISSSGNDVFQLSGIDGTDTYSTTSNGNTTSTSTNLNFTTGYDNNNNPVLIEANGTQEPLSTVSSVYCDQLTNVTLNVHDMNFGNLTSNESSLQIITANSDGSPLPSPNGSFTYDSSYDNATPMYNAPSTTPTAPPEGMVAGEFGQSTVY